MFVQTVGPVTGKLVGAAKNHVEKEEFVTGKAVDAKRNLVLVNQDLLEVERNPVIVNVLLVEKAKLGIKLPKNAGKVSDLGDPLLKNPDPDSQGNTKDIANMAVINLDTANQNRPKNLAVGDLPGKAVLVANHANLAKLEAAQLAGAVVSHAKKDK